MSPKFIKKVEDFTCEHCGTEVKGNGYTNHCPNCLYSKHVDINPGDRLEPCGGLMKPISYDYEKGEYILIFRCEKCGLIRRNKTYPADNFDEIIKLTKKLQ